MSAALEEVANCAFTDRPVPDILIEMRWPPYFPANCPDGDSVPANGGVYRIVAGEPPKPKDFQSHRERNLGQFYSNECMACGLSVFTRLEDASALIEAIPAFRKRRIAHGHLTPALGVMKPTPSHGSEMSSHHTWWVPAGAEPWSVFHVVTLDGGASP